MKTKEYSARLSVEGAKDVFVDVQKDRGLLVTIERKFSPTEGKNLVEYIKRFYEESNLYINEAMTQVDIVLEKSLPVLNEQAKDLAVKLTEYFPECKIAEEFEY